MTDLLTAVENLTKPKRIKRLVELDHDHDWMSVKIITTKAEIRRVKRENKTRKAEGLDLLTVPEEVVDTGEWWCPWCNAKTTMPEHQWPSIDTVEQDDPSLLDRLETAFAPDQGQSGAKLAGREQVPIGVDAFDKALEIRRKVGAWYRRLDATAGANIPLRQLVTSWHVLHLGSTEADDDYARQLRTWAHDIRNLLDPKPPRPEIIGICPRCEFAFVITPEGTRKRALQGVEGDSYETTSVTCQVCGQDWTGRNALGELANASRRLEGRQELASEPFKETA